MNAQEIIQLGREWSWHTDTTSYTDAQALTDLNVAYRDLIAQVNQDVNEDLFATDWYADSVAGQMEYTLPTTDDATGRNGMDNLLGVSFNYAVDNVGAGTASTTAGSDIIVLNDGTDSLRVGYLLSVPAGTYRIVSISGNNVKVAAIDVPFPTTTESGLAWKWNEGKYVRCYPERLSNLEYDLSYYGVNQPKEKPFYVKFDTGIRVFPYATDAVKGALKITGTYDPAKLVLSPTPTTPIIDDNWHYVLAIGVKKFSFLRRGMTAEYNLASQEFANEVRKVINTLSDSELSPLSRDIPTLDQLQ